METEKSIKELIIAFTEKTNTSIFVTGKAGTGKTTFLHEFKTTTTKNFAVVAPTAVAAINAGGSTIHSFFQIPIGPQAPIQGEILSLRINREKLMLLTKLDLLIIDEISMVRVDTIDYIDKMLKQIRCSSMPFGGVQVMMIGDLFQLPPVWERDWNILGKYYKGPYFFNSKVFEKSQIVTFELTKVFRQSDTTFISILNDIRMGSIGENQIKILNGRCRPAPEIIQLQDYITLTTHVDSVNTINNGRLSALESESFYFKAEVLGDFSEDAYPVDAELILKVGAQVMFIKNDTSGNKKYYNGRTARVSSLSKDQISVEFIDDGTEFDVPRETWQNIKFSLSDSGEKIEEANTGTFIQYPLRLAWAITIHKSQGLTFEKAIIDVASSFAPGQTYVALSRCKTLEGIVLKSPIEYDNVKVDDNIFNFIQKATHDVPNWNTLEEASLRSELIIIIDVFDFSMLSVAWLNYVSYLTPLMQEKNIFKQDLIDDISQLVNKDLVDVGDRFIRRDIIPLRLGRKEIDKFFKERVKSGVIYFQPKLEAFQNLTDQLYQQICEINFDSNFYNLLNQLNLSLKVKLSMLHGSTFLNSPKEAYLYACQEGSTYKPIYKIWQPKPLKEQEVINAGLYHDLLQWRRGVAESNGLPEYSLISEKILREIAKKLPQTFNELAQIKNLNVQRAKEYGDSIIKLVSSFIGKGDTLF